MEATSWQAPRQAPWGGHGPTDRPSPTVQGCNTMSNRLWTLQLGSSSCAYQMALDTQACQNTKMWGFSS